MKLCEMVKETIMQMMEQKASEIMESFNVKDFIEYCFYNEKVDMVIREKFKETIKENILSVVRKNADQAIINATNKKNF